MNKTKSFAFWYLMFIWVLCFLCIKGFWSIDPTKINFKISLIGYLIASRLIIRPLATRSVAYLSWKSFIPILQDYEYIDSRNSKIIFITGYVLAVVIALLAYIMPYSMYEMLGFSILDKGSIMMNMFFIAILCTMISRFVFALALLHVIDDSEGYSAEKSIGSQIFKVLSRVLSFIPVLRTATFIYMMIAELNIKGDK